PTVPTHRPSPRAKRWCCTCCPTAPSTFRRTSNDDTIAAAVHAARPLGRASAPVCLAAKAGVPAQTTQQEDAIVDYLEVDGTRLEYRWIGPAPEAAPTLVFLHEGLGCVALWKDFPDRVAAATGCGVLVYSRAGYGSSDPVE